MKRLSIIFSIFVLCLSLMPCQDSVAQSIENFSSQITEARNPHHHENDACSPFCVCTCCTTSSITLIVTTLDYIPFEVKVNYAGHLPKNFIDIYQAVWQPPQQA